MWGVTCSPGETGDLVLDLRGCPRRPVPKPARNFSLFPSIQRGSLAPLMGGHAMGHVLLYSSVSKRNSLPSEMLEVPYGERNIIISLSSSRIDVLTELLSPQRLCSQARSPGRQLGRRPRNVFPEVQALAPRDGTTHVHTLPGSTSSRFSAG